MLYDEIKFRSPNLPLEINLLISVYSSLLVTWIVLAMLLKAEAKEKKFMMILAKSLGGEMRSEQDLEKDFISAHGKMGENSFECQLIKDTHASIAWPSFFKKIVFQKAFPGYLMIKKFPVSYDDAAAREIESYESRVFAKYPDAYQEVNSHSADSHGHSSHPPDETLLFDHTLAIKKNGSPAENLLKDENKQKILKEIFSDLMPDGWNEYLFKPVDWLLLYENAAVIHFGLPGEYIRWDDISSTRLPKFQRYLKLLSEFASG